MPMITGREACDMNFQIKAVQEVEPNLPFWLIF